MKRRSERPTTATATVLVLGLLLWSGAAAQNIGSASPEPISAIRPLLEVKGMLESAYSRPVTYEESVLIWPGDLAVNPAVENEKLALMPKRRSFLLPFRLDAADASVLDAALLGRVLEAYHAQNDGPRFAVASSSYGLHILPALAADATGRLAPVAPLLDTAITVPVGRRSPEGHLVALCQAVTARSGTDVRGAPSLEFNRHFAHAGSVCPGGISVAVGAPTPSDCVFEWGAASIPAREALISLLEQSSTTMTWQLLCQHGTPSLCILGVGPLIVHAVDADGQSRRHYLLYDRCTVCPPPGRYLAPLGN